MSNSANAPPTGPLTDLRHSGLAPLPTAPRERAPWYGGSRS